MIQRDVLSVMNLDKVLPKNHNFDFKLIVSQELYDSGIPQVLLYDKIVEVFRMNLMFQGISLEDEIKKGRFKNMVSVNTSFSSNQWEVQQNNS